MSSETVDRVEISESGDLLIHLRDGGSPSFQYVYRAAAGVYWDNEKSSFKFSPHDDLYPKWLIHIVAVVESELGVKLMFEKNVAWVNVPSAMKDKMQQGIV